MVGVVITGAEVCAGGLVVVVLGQVVTVGQVGVGGHDVVVGLVVTDVVDSQLNPKLACLPYFTRNNKKGYS